jgi:hypothetical protein
MDRLSDQAGQRALGAFAAIPSSGPRMPRNSWNAGTRSGDSVNRNRKTDGVWVAESAASRIGPLAECTAASPASDTSTSRITNRTEQTWSANSLRAMIRQPPR